MPLNPFKIFTGSKISALIILDDNFLLQSMRKPYYNLGALFKTGFAELAFKVLFETSLRRNGSRKENIQVPKEVITSALEKYQITKYVDNLIEVENDVDNKWDEESLKALVAKIEEKMAKKLEKKDDELSNEEKLRLGSVNVESLLH